MIAFARYTACYHRQSRSHAAYVVRCSCDCLVSAPPYWEGSVTLHFRCHAGRLARFGARQYTSKHQRADGTRIHFSAVRAKCAGRTAGPAKSLHSCSFARIVFRRTLSLTPENKGKLPLRSHPSCSAVMLYPCSTQGSVSPLRAPGRSASRQGPFDVVHRPIWALKSC